MSEGSRQTDESLWDVGDVARYLKVSEATVRLRVLNDEIPYFKVGRLVRFRRSEIDAWIAEENRQREQPASEPAEATDPAA